MQTIHENDFMRFLEDTLGLGENCTEIDYDIMFEIKDKIIDAPKKPENSKRRVVNRSKRG